MVIELMFPSSFEELLILEFNLSIVDDTIVESTEQIDLFLNTSQEGVFLGDEGSIATVNVFNDDSENQHISVDYPQWMYIQLRFST